MISKLSLKTKVSVILTSYNGERFIHEAIHSILEQTFIDYKFVIVNDGSNDLTEKIVTSIKDPRIEYYRIDRGGHVNALNYGLSKCKTELTTIIDHDDIALPDKLEKQVSLFSLNSNFGVVGTSYYIINNLGKVINKITVPSQNDKIINTLQYRDVLCHSGVMYKTKLIKEIGGYNPKYNTAADYALWLKLISKTNFHNICEPLMKIRKHSHSQTSPLTSYKRNNEDALLALNDLMQNWVEDKKYLEYIWKIIYGDIKTGRKLLLKDIVNNKLSLDLKIKIKYLLMSVLNRKIINYYYYFNPFRKIKYRLHI